MVDDAARTIRLLLATRFVRSIGQGALAVDLTLYLRALQWSAVAISAVLSAALLVGVVLTLIAGPLSDRGGRRRFLFVYEAAQCVAGVTALVSAQSAILTAAAVVGGFGRGGNGAAGPFAPVEQAWLAQAVSPSRRGPVYSLNAALGFLGNAVGAVCAALPDHVGDAAWPARVPAVVPAVGSRVVAVLRTDPAYAGQRDWAVPRAPVEEPAAPGVHREENRLVLRLMIANAMNGAGVGATGPLIAYWFAVRFGEGPGEIGPLLAGGFLMAAVASVATGWLSQARHRAGGRGDAAGGPRAADRSAVRAELRCGGRAVRAARHVQPRHDRGAGCVERQYRPGAAAGLRGKHGERFDAGAAVGQSDADRVPVRGRRPRAAVLHRRRVPGRLSRDVLRKLPARR